MVVRNQASRYHLVVDALNNARRTDQCRPFADASGECPGVDAGHGAHWRRPISSATRRDTRACESPWKP
jgi:hypothetical protein